MKRHLFISILLSVCLLAAGQGYDTLHSYVSKRIYLNEEGTKYIDNVTYLDGFGRKLQEVQVKGSPDGTSDLVQPYSYGKLGRTERTYLPYAKANNNGTFVNDPLNASHWNVYGTTDAAYAFTKTEYDNSPLNRIIRQTGPGAAWHTAAKAVSTTHSMNSANEVRLYRVNRTSGVLYQDGHYRAGSLEKVITTDEDGHTTETFTDNQGKTVLTVAVNGTERLETYYVYDYRELLRWVLSPEAAHRVASGIDTEALYKYAYYYEYDALKRMTFKKLPGCEPVYMVYDKRDRLVLTQDGNMRASNANKWSYTEYNAKNRPVESGEIVLGTSATHSELINSMMNSESVPSGIRTPMQYIRYDKYTANEHVTPHAFVAVSGYANDYHPLTTGLVTATKTRVLGTDQWITSTVYYDSKCRPMQEIIDNLVGGVTKVTHSYDFVGNVVKSQEAHGANTLKYAYTYDDRSRLLNVTASLNGATPVTMKTLEYDEVGRLKKVKLHNNTTSSEYDYNIRSWLTGITGSKFTQSLTYGNGNGNIQNMNWNANGSSHSYSFTYDGANRLLDAIHGTGAYTEKVTGYDKNGNILALQRYGNGLIDDLTYTYNGNQLTKVEDATGNAAGFSNGTSTTNEYTYDYNGNLTKDSNKGISNISWNSLNLPNVVSFSDGSTITYTYAADGTKLRTVHNINGTTTQTDYCGSAIYENGTAKLWQTEAGYISTNDSKYHYYLQDHQGNNRVVVSETGATEEVNHYYAFGGLFSSNEGVQPFKYNGKELDTKKGLNWYDYGARQYDATLGRFISADPSAENYYDTGIYAYCGSNPINRIDPTGADWYQDDKGNYRWQQGSDNLEGYTNIGSTFSMELGENSFLNFYQNGGIWANQAANAVDLIYASPKLQAQFLGIGSVLSEEDQISLFRAIMSRKGAELIQPIMQEGLSWAIGGLGGKALGKAVGWTIGKVSNYLRGSYSIKIATETVRPYTKSNLRLGQEMHKLYHAGEYGKEFRLPSGKRIDFLDLKNRRIYELKPFNPRAMKQGEKQLQMYLQELETMPDFQGWKWETILETY